MTGTHFEASWDQARELVHNVARIQPSVEVVVANAHGFVLAQDIHALADMPPFAASRIDGWAVSGPGPWRNVGDARAGHESSVTLAHGECIHIATGAVMPPGATACLKDEESALVGDLVSAAEGALGILEADGSLPNMHDVRPVGYEARNGELLIAAHTTLSPALVGLTAGAGHDTLRVFTKPTVDVIIFGDELLDDGPSRDGKVRDSLGPQLSGWISFLGADLNSVNRAEDTLDAHVSAINRSTADIIVTTGGTAAGPVDHLHRAINECGGDLLVDAVLVRPGYHQLFAQLTSQVLIGLPGNPQSAVIGLLSLGAAHIAGMYGQPIPELPTRTVSRAIRAPRHEIKFTLCKESAEHVTPVEHVDSSMLRGFAQADGYAIVPAGGVIEGAIVRWLALP